MFFIHSFFRSLLQFLFAKIFTSRVFVLRLIISAIAFSLIIGIQSNAQQHNIKQPKAAVIQDYERKIDESSKKNFQVFSDSKTSFGSPISAQLNISRGGKLLVPSDGKAWAKMYFLDQKNEKAYGGLTVQTRVEKPRPKFLRLNTYVFPCYFSGKYIIALRSGNAACGIGDGGIRIITNPERAIKNKQSFKSKQNSPEARSDLIINPGQGQTVIRTNVDGTATVLGYEEECKEIKPESLPIISGRPGVESKPPTPQCQKKPKNTVSDIIRIEVLEGDILIKSEEKPEGEQVREGQQYSYPNPKLETIDASKEANSCEVLRFLNAYYWSYQTPKPVFDEIVEQLKQHRKDLGVSGRFPQGSYKLNKLEQDIFDEMNRERENRNLPPFSISEGMSRANRDHVNHQVESSKYIGHSGDKSVGTGERLRRYGAIGCARYDEDEFENIIYFKDSSIQGVPTGQSVVAAMTTKDKLRRTGRKDNLFNPDFQVVGVACDSKMSEMCVITYTEGYLEKD